MAKGLVLNSTPEILRTELRAFLRSGFPLTETNAGSVLTEQRVVLANAQHPDQWASRITSLERVIRQLLDGFGKSTRGRAARILFATDRGLRGTTLTLRRQTAADMLERTADHIRKHIEPKILDELAFAFHQENLRYQPAADSARPKLAAHEDTPVITDESYTEEEELLCRLWSAVYGYRSEIIAIQRRLNESRIEERAPDADLQEHIDTGTWQLARLLTFVADYLEQYGDEILHGDTPFNIEGLVNLAGWHGELSSDEAKRLRYVMAKTGPNDMAAFLKDFGKRI